MVDRRTDMMQTLEEGAARTITFFKSLPPADLDRTVYEDDVHWTVRQVLAHFITIEKSLQWLFRNMLAGGPGRDQGEGDYSHLGFALESRDAVDAVAARAERVGCLAWPPREEPYPVGYYCGLRDPDGNFVEFSYGQPLGPGAKEAGPTP